MSTGFKGGAGTRARARSNPPAGLRGADRQFWISRHGTAWERCLQGVINSRRWGLARHSMHKANPPLHIVVESGREWRTWCGYGLADEGQRNVTGRRCPRCMTLAREEADESYEDYIEEADRG